MLERVGKCATEDPHCGVEFTRLATDVFQIEGRTARHDCIVSKPHLSSLRTLQEALPDAKLPKLLIKCILQRELHSVNWLHAACGVVHTGSIPCKTPSMFNRD